MNLLKILSTLRTNGILPTLFLIFILQLPVNKSTAQSCPEPDVSGQVYYTVSDGDWDSESTWAGNNKPSDDIGSNNKVVITHNIVFSGSSSFKPSNNSVLVIKDGGKLETAKAVKIEKSVNFIINGGELYISDGDFKVDDDDAKICFINACVYSGKDIKFEDAESINLYSTGLIGQKLKSKTGITGSDIRIWTSGKIERSSGNWDGSTISYFRASSSSGFSNLPARSSESEIESVIRPCEEETTTPPSPPFIASSNCAPIAGLGCSATDYSNYGFNSTSNAATLEYDNFVSGYHSTMVRASDGRLLIWGESAANDGSSNLLSQTEINNTNFPGITGIPLKFAMGSKKTKHQRVVLTTDGLFVWGDPNYLIPSELYNQNQFGKLTVDSKDDGLPPGVGPTDVKMLYGTYGTLALVTCDGALWTLTKYSDVQGNNQSADKTKWARVKISADDNLRNVIAVRGVYHTFIALTSDNKVYTWGNSTSLGDEASYSLTSRKYATEMALPEQSQIKMIGVTHLYDGSTRVPTYYILYTNGKLFAMGNNQMKQLGDFTTTNNPGWVQPHYPNSSGNKGAAMDDVKWISPNEHDPAWPAINIINNGGKIWNWGMNAGTMLGRSPDNDENNDVTILNAYDPGQPLSSSEFDPETTRVLTVETGGHTTMIAAECEEYYGYAGHEYSGSTGSGSSSGAHYATFTFTTSRLQVCGASTIPDILISAGTILVGDNNDLVCSNESVELIGFPEGGGFSVLSGPATIDPDNGNILIINDGNTSGEIRVRYTYVESVCSTAYADTTIQFQSCAVLKATGKVWNDFNKNVIIDNSEHGTDGVTELNTGIWVNLVNDNDKVVNSVPVNEDGTYELSTIIPGAYSVRITSLQVANGAEIPGYVDGLPGTWNFTGNNINNTPVCIVAGTNPCATPQIISNVNLDDDNVIGLNFGIVNLGTVAIKLLGFNVYKNENTANLVWSATQDGTVSGFDIERSNDGRFWNKIGLVNSDSGDIIGGELSAYRYKDQEPLNGMNYYRLRQVEKDGSFTYSDIKSISIVKKSGISVYPNPTVSTVHITGLNGSGKIIIYDNIGRQVISEKTTESRHSLNVSNLLPGVYHLLIVEDNGYVSSFKIQKK